MDVNSGIGVAYPARISCFIRYEAVCRLCPLEYDVWARLLVESEEKPVLPG